jgi:hypothetical protein
VCVLFSTLFRFLHSFPPVLLPVYPIVAIINIHSSVILFNEFVNVEEDLS